MMQNVRKLSDKDFIQALVVQQSGNSARLLDTMLHMLPLQTCMPGKENITNEVIKAIWEHPCSAYASLRKRIKPKAKEILKGYISLQFDSSYHIQVDATTRKIRWYR